MPAQEDVCELIARIAEVEIGTFDGTTGLLGLGWACGDSLMSTELLKEVQSDIGAELLADELADVETVIELTALVRNKASLSGGFASSMRHQVDGLYSRAPTSPWRDDETHVALILSELRQSHLETDLARHANVDATLADHGPDSLLEC